LGRAIILVINASFSLDEYGTKAVTNKSQFDLPYGSLFRNFSREDLEESVGKLFSGNNIDLRARYDDNIILNVMKKIQYAAIGAYCAVAAFKTLHPKDRKFTFGDLIHSEREDIGEFTRKLTTQENHHQHRALYFYPRRKFMSVYQLTHT